MKLNYGWVVVAAGAVMSCIAIGTTFSLAVFLQPIALETGWWRTGISSAMTIVFVTMGIGGFGGGGVAPRFCPPLLRRSGGVPLGLGGCPASAGGDPPRIRAGLWL